MAKFIIVLCAFVATASAGPGLVAPLGGVPLAYAQGLSYSSPLTYSPSLAYTSPVAYGLASGGSSRIDIQNNYNLAPQFAVPFAARFAAPYTTTAAFAPAVQAQLAPAPLNYNVAQLAAAQPAPVAFSAPVAGAPLAKFAAPVQLPFAAPQFIPAPLKYSAPLLSNYNYYASPLSYAFPGQINNLPSGLPIAPVQLAAEASNVQITRMTAVPSESDAENDSEDVPAKLVSTATPSESVEEQQKFATPAPVDGESPVAREGSQSPVAPVVSGNTN